MTKTSEIKLVDATFAPGSNQKEFLARNANHDSFFAKHKRRQRVFCCFLGDIFYDGLRPEARANLFKLIASTPNIDWLFLTGQIENADRLITETGSLLSKTRPFDAGGCPHDKAEGMCNAWNNGFPPWNIWLGISITNQEEADRDIPKLLEIPARVRFLFIEPMLGNINLMHHFQTRKPGDGGIHWVIAGGESGPYSRPTHPDWFRSIRDQCASAGVPFFFKGWGDGPTQRAGECAAGRHLDGRTHDEFPEDQK